MCIFENLEEIWKIWKKFGKNEWQPCIMLQLIYLNLKLSSCLRILIV